METPDGATDEADTGQFLGGADATKLGTQEVLGQSLRLNEWFPEETSNSLLRKDILILGQLSGWEIPPCHTHGIFRGDFSPSKNGFGKVKTQTANTFKHLDAFLVPDLPLRLLFNFGSGPTCHLVQLGVRNCQQSLKARGGGDSPQAFSIKNERDKSWCLGSRRGAGGL